MTDRPAFTLAWFALLLAVVFTTAFWVGHAAGPTPIEVEPSPHTSSGTH